MMLKINFKLLFYLCFLHNIFIVANLQESFLQANQAYLQGNFALAQDLYKTISDTQEIAGPVVMYNLGNCYFQQKMYLLAINAWLYAYKFGDRATALYSYTNIVVAQTNLAIQATMTYGFNDFVNNLFFREYFLSWQLFFWLLIIGIFVARIKWLIGRKLIWSLIILVQLSMMGLAILCAKVDKLSYAVVQNSATLFAGPADSYHIIGNVQSGHVFKVVSSTADWCLVQERGLHGWLAKKELHIV